MNRQRTHQQLSEEELIQIAITNSLSKDADFRKMEDGDDSEIAEVDTTSSRYLREEQDREYEESLRIDQMKALEKEKQILAQEEAMFTGDGEDDYDYEDEYENEYEPQQQGLTKEEELKRLREARMKFFANK